MTVDTFFSSTTPQEQNNNHIRLLIVDDQKFVRAKIKDILSTHSDLEVIGIAVDGDQAISKIKDLQPSVVLMDIEMPKMNGIEVTKIISQQFLDTKILVLSTHEKEEYIQKIINAGADGYILKQTPVFDFVAAIYAVHKGYSHFGPNIFKKVQINASSSATNPTKFDSKKFKSKSNGFQDNCQILDVSSGQKRIDLAKEYSVTKPTDQDRALPTVEAEEFLPPIERWLTWGGLSVMFILVLILPLSSVLRYKTKVRAPATLRPLGEIRLVQAKTEGQISEVLLEVGDSVVKGDVIATIDRSRLMTQKSQLSKAIAQQKLQLVQLNAQIANVNSQVTAETERNSSEIQGAESQLSVSLRVYQDRTVEVTSQVEEAQANLRAIEATLSAAENQLIRYSNAAAEGALSKEQLAEAKLEVMQQQQEIGAAKARLKSAQATLDPSNGEVNVARQNIEQAKKSGQASIASLNREKESILQQRLRIDQQLEQDIAELKQAEIDLEQTDIKATATGEILALNLRNPGQTVQSGQEIAQIVPKDVALEIKTLVLPQDISKLKPGQKTQIRVSSCPYPDYGVLNGKVKRISQDVSQSRNPNNSQMPQQQPPPAYEVFVQPEAKSFGRQDNQCILQPGMEGTAEIITREETVLRFILRKARLISNV